MDPANRRRAGRPDAAKRLIVEERREHVAALLVSGATYRQMAVALGASKSIIGRDVQVLRARHRERAGQAYDEVVAEEIAKLDALERTWMPRALRSDATAADLLAVVRLLERRARFRGLDQPAKVEANVRITETTELDRKIEELLAQQVPDREPS